MYVIGFEEIMNMYQTSLSPISTPQPTLGSGFKHTQYIVHQNVISIMYTFVYIIINVATCPCTYMYMHIHVHAHTCTLYEYIFVTHRKQSLQHFNDSILQVSVVGMATVHTTISGDHRINS